MYRIGKEEIDAVARVIRSGNLFKINDACKESEQCEAEMRDYFGSKNVLVMTSGKAALISALTALGIGPGDEVIVPAYTYIATAMAVVAVGAIPVIAEVDDTLTLDIADTEKKISRHTKALLPVHIQGFPCNMEALQALAEKYGLKIVEDACQAVGGSYKGKSLGTIGDAGVFSFNQFKIISAGEGGALLTDSRAVYERALIYHDSSAVAYFGKQLQEIRQPVFSKNRMGFANRNYFFGKSIQILILFPIFTIHPADLIILAIRIVVSFLTVTELIPHKKQRRSRR